MLKKTECKLSYFKNYPAVLKGDWVEEEIAGNTAD